MNGIIDFFAQYRVSFEKKCTGDWCSGLSGSDDAPDGSVDDDSVRLDLVDRKVVRRVPPDDQGLVEVGLEGQLLRGRDTFFGDAAGIGLLVFGVVEV
jgi:hypothetical protein